MGISKLLRREKTLPKTRGTITFYGSTIYVPVYGKTSFKVGGRGTPGNPSTGGNVSGTNPDTGGNISYNPPTGGNYAGTNPPTGGNFAYTNNPTGGNYAGTNPTSPGNYYTNPNTYTPGTANESYYDSYNTAKWSVCPPGWTTSFGESEEYDFGNFKICSTYVASNTNPDTYTAGNTGTNPDVPGNAYYNPIEYGYLNYNPIDPGYPYYNPTVNGNSYYNPNVPGNSNYNPITPGNSGATNTVLGITFSGGSAGLAAPVISPTPISLSYTPAGVSITVPTGGYVDITNL
jgi:hypothetical protein